jgi:hypothetical protein
MRGQAAASGIEADTMDRDQRASDPEVEKSAFAGAVNLAEGRGGEVRRGLKSRHIQFL